MEDITREYKNNKAIYRKLELDYTIVKLCERNLLYKSLDHQDIEQVFIYYYEDLVDTDDLELILGDNLFEMFPSENDYTFIKDFETIEDLILWFRLQ